MDCQSDTFSCQVSTERRVRLGLVRAAQAEKFEAAARSAYYGKSPEGDWEGAWGSVRESWREYVRGESLDTRASTLREESLPWLAARHPWETLEELYREIWRRRQADVEISDYDDQGRPAEGCALQGCLCNVGVNYTPFDQDDAPTPTETQSIEREARAVEADEFEGPWELTEPVDFSDINLTDCFYGPDPDLAPEAPYDDLNPENRCPDCGWPRSYGRTYCTHCRIRTALGMRRACDRQDIYDNPVKHTHCAGDRCRAYPSRVIVEPVTLSEHVEEVRAFSAADVNEPCDHDWVQEPGTPVFCRRCEEEAFDPPEPTAPTRARDRWPLFAATEFGTVHQPKRVYSANAVWKRAQATEFGKIYAYKVAKEPRRWWRRFWEGNA